jgi:hypothetical protein
MPTFMTILSCVLIAQLSTEQPQSAPPVEQFQQSKSAEDSRPAADALTPAAEPANSTAEQALPSEIPDAASSPKSQAAAGEQASTSTDQPASLRIRPPRLIAEALTLPAGSALTGQPLPLVQALSVTADRRQQLAITHAYWQTAEAVAKYHYCLDHANQLGRLQSPPSEEASLQAARSAATAMLREAELAAGSAQYELAALVQFSADAPPPLPADRPHVGAYRTNYQDLFAARQAPDRARLIDRTLPVRRMAIDQWAIAIQAAQDASAAAIDAYQAGQGNLASVVSNSGQLIRRQHAFIETVCRYNHDIAEYAMLVAAPGATPQVLVGYMIKTTREPGQSTIIESESGVRPAGLNEPASSPMTWNGKNQPTLAPRNVQGASAIPTVPATQWGPSTSPTKNEPTLAPPLNTATLGEKKVPTPAQPRGLAPVGAKNEPTLAPPRPESKSKTENQTPPDETQSEEPIKIRYSVGDPFMRRAETANKPVVELAAASDSEFSADRQESTTDSASPSPASALANAATSTALYPALAGTSPAVRAKQLALALHWDRSLPDGTGRPMTLEECLSRSAAADRRATVDAFWTTRQRAAEYQSIAQEIEFFDNLMPIVLERRAKPDSAAAMLFLRAARQSAKAKLKETQAALIEAQFELALRTQSTSESLWPLPSTPPHAGQYLLNLEAQPRSLVESWPMRRLAAAIPTYGTSVQEHADSVVAADSARAKAIEHYTNGNLPMEQVLDDVARQTQQTFDFLQTLTDYNRSIAQYALAVLPPDAPPTRIAAALVVQR